MSSLEARSAPQGGHSSYILTLSFTSMRSENCKELDGAFNSLVTNNKSHITVLTLEI